MKRQRLVQSHQVVDRVALHSDKNGKLTAIDDAPMEIKSIKFPKRETCSSKGTFSSRSCNLLCLQRGLDGSRVEPSWISAQQKWFDDLSGSTMETTMKKAWIMSTLVFPFIISSTSFGQNFPRNYGNGSAIITGPELGGNNGTRPDQGYYVPRSPPGYGYVLRGLRQHHHVQAKSRRSSEIAH